MYTTKDGIISLEETDKHIEEAYEKGFYLEAITIIHVDLEFFMRQIILLNANINMDSVSDKKWNLIHEIRYIQLAKLLFALDFIDENIYNELQTFNKTRNRIVHDLFNLSYKKKGISKKTLDQHFELGKKLLDEICKIVEKQIEVPAE